nr:hypothetical protein [Tanacetum cinerariifolium]
MTSLTLFCEMACQIFQKKQEEKQLEEEQVAKAQNWKLPVFYDDDDDEERSNSLEDNIISVLPPCSLITPNEPVLSTEKPDNSLSMGDEHLDTIWATKSDEVIKSSVENLIPIPSESEGLHEMAMAAFESQYIDRDTYSASVDDIEVFCGHWSTNAITILNEKGGPKEDQCIMSYPSQGVSVWEGAEVVHLQAGVFK